MVSSMMVVYQLPSVQIIGAQKAGTSAIADWLFEEGGFRRPKVFDDGGEPFYYSKEVHYFDIDSRYYKGVEFYAKRFQQQQQLDDDGSKMKKQRSLDATPDTMVFPERVRFTYEAAGGNQVNTVKFIAILREPISRELSLYNHLAYDCRKLDALERTDWHNQVLKEDDDDDDDCRSIMSFDEFVCQRSLPSLKINDTNGCGRSTRHGMYVTHLLKWFEVFDRQQILLLSYTELQQNPLKVQERINKILQLEIPGQIKYANSNDNPHKVKFPSRDAQEKLLAVFTPLNEELFKLLESNPGPPMEQRPFPSFHHHPSQK